MDIEVYGQMVYATLSGIVPGVVAFIFAGCIAAFIVVVIIKAFNSNKGDEIIKRD